MACKSPLHQRARGLRTRISPHGNDVENMAESPSSPSSPHTSPRLIVFSAPIDDVVVDEIHPVALKRTRDRLLPDRNRQRGNTDARVELQQVPSFRARGSGLSPSSCRAGHTRPLPTFGDEKTRGCWIRPAQNLLRMHDPGEEWDSGSVPALSDIGKSCLRRERATAPHRRTRRWTLGGPEVPLAPPDGIPDREMTVG